MDAKPRAALNQSSCAAVVGAVCLSRRVQAIPSHDFWVESKGADSVTARVERQAVILPAGCNIDLKPCCKFRGLTQA